MFEWFNNLAFPPRVQVIDNNVRYVAISNLSLLAVLDTPKFFEKYPLLQPSLEDAIRNDTDQSILIHCLRLLKTVGKSGNSVSTNTEGEKRLLHFWLSVLKPSLLDSVEELTRLRCDAKILLRLVNLTLAKRSLFCLFICLSWALEIQ